MKNNEIYYAPWWDQAAYMTKLFGFAFLRNCPNDIEVLWTDRLLEWAEKFDKEEFIKRVKEMEKIEFEQKKHFNPYWSSLVEYIKKRLEPEIYRVQKNLFTCWKYNFRIQGNAHLDVLMGNVEYKVGDKLYSQPFIKNWIRTISDSVAAKWFMECVEELEEYLKSKTWN